MNIDKKIAISALVGVLLIGIISASFLTYFGKITGSVEVEAPVFYTIAYENQKETILSPSGEEIEAYLLSTEKEDYSKSFDINLNCYPMGGCEAKFMQFFTTEELGINYFYDSEWEFYTNLKIINKTNPNGDCNVYTKLFKIHEESGIGNYVIIGRSDYTDPIPEQYYYEDMISTINMPYTEMTLKDRFYVEYWANCSYGDYNLKFRIGDDKTRIEISAT